MTLLSHLCSRDVTQSLCLTGITPKAARHRLKLTGKVLTNMIEAREDATAESEKSMIEEKTTSVLQQRERDAVFEDMVAAQSAR